MSPPQRHLHAASNLLRLVPAADTLAVFHRLAEAPWPNARVIGLIGLLRASTPGAALDLEKDWPHLTPTLEAPRLSSAFAGLARFPREDQLALARLALRNSIPPFFEAAVAGQLAPLGDDALPFLAALLESPDAEVRAAAISSSCLVLRHTLENPGLWCPARPPRADTPANREFSSFWRKRLSDLGIRPHAAPARYAVSTPRRPAEVGDTAEDRLWRLALSTNPRTIPNSSPADRDLFVLLFRALRAEYESLTRDYTLNLIERRNQGLPPDPVLLADYQRRIQSSRKASLDRFRRELSPAALRSLDDALQSQSRPRPDSAPNR